MEIHRDQTYAVITGDIIGSSKLDPANRQELHQVMLTACSRLREVFARAVPLEVDIFRGDSWQLLVTEPEKSLRIGLLYRLDIKIRFASKVDSRLAIGLGRILFLPGDRVSQGEGPAFRLSGQALDNLPAYSALGLGMDSSGQQQGCSELLQGSLFLLDAILRSWSPKQALAVYGALQDWTQERITSLWQPKISQQTVAEYLQKAGWGNVKHFLRVFEANVPFSGP
ncbi:MAG: hypothetical protein ACOC43_15350 [Desulfohalobiaceae bacterium]